MSSDLTKAIAAAGATYNSPFAELEAINKRLRELQLEGGKVDSDALNHLEQVLGEMPQVAELIGKHCYFLKSSRLVTTSGFARWLLERAWKTSPEQACQELGAFLDSDSFPCHIVMLLTGPHIDDASIDMGDGIRLVPLREIPLSRQTTELWLDPGRTHLGNSIGPTCALVGALTHPKLFLSSDETPPDELDSLGQKACEALADTRLCLTLSGPCAAIPLSAWMAPDASVPLPYLGEGKRSYVASERPVSKTIKTDDPVIEDAQKFRRLKEKDKKWLGVPLHYLGESIASSNLIFSSINLGIAMEGLFLHDLKERSELTFRLCTRAARYLGDTSEERKKIYKLFKELYHLRSISVHTGSILPDDLDTPVNSYLRECDEKLSRGKTQMAVALRKAIHNPAIDWHNVTLA